MKDEIKEKLDNLRIYAGREENGFICDIEDYITNLQEENERLKIEKQEEYNRFNLMAKFRDKALVRELIYKSRNEKAIEYIKDRLEEGCLDKLNYYDLHKTKNILQGEEKDE